ncbi:MAG TPA: EAL domain-containing protein, partial [Gammaproteobacteria bacterium]|nr:EAL domain-containing protein [Gammaproteobacteria bacterium]
YEAKRTRQGLVVFHPNHQSDVSERLTRINELFEDIHHARIPLHYQPKVDTASGTVVGAEALLRWGPGDSHLLPPPEVFAMAERAGVAQDLTLRVLNAAIRQCAAWRTAGWDLTVAVNLSVNDLQMPNLIDRVREGLSAWDLPARRLELEITENAMMAEPERAHRVLAELRALGIRIAVDDYGTGYSSLAYLKGLPVDVLKIDKSFVMELAEDPHDQAIVRSTVELGHSLGLEVVAEGVENEAGQALLTQWQCQRAQGFHLGRPMDPADFLRHVTDGP